MLEQTKRKFSRINFERSVNLDFFTHEYNGCQIKDLSLTGMYITGTFPQQIGELCDVILVQQGISSHLELKASARVVRVDNEGIAIEFTSMTLESNMFLQVTLLYEAHDPLAIGLEFPEDFPFEIIDPSLTIPEPAYSFKAMENSNSMLH